MTVIAGNRSVRVRKGLGDVVEVLAKPVARVVGLEGCQPCQQRKEALNALSDAVVDKTKSFGRRIFRNKVTIR